MKHQSLKLIVISSLLVLSCMRDDKLNREFSSITPLDIDDGTQISSPELEGVDSAALVDIYRDVYRDKNLWSLRSLLVYRNGNLLAESYLKNEDDITDRHIVWSCTKQVMGILTGIAVDSGIISSIDDPISQYFDTELDRHSDKGVITIRNLITMRSGIDYKNDGNEGQTDQLLREIPDNSIEFILNRPIDAVQGSSFHYNDGNPHLMSALIQEQTGVTTSLWADEVLFSKIGVTNYNWVKYRDGITLGGFGIETTPRELGKIANLVADSGRWRGEEIVSPEWITAMTSPQVKNTGSDYTFGYFWWINPSRGLHFMWGHGGQFAFIFPKKNLLVVMTSIPNTQGDYQISADEAISYVDRIIEIAE